MTDEAPPSEPVTDAAPAPPPAAPPSPTHPHALFAVGSMRFSLPIASVGEVVSEMSLTRLPHASRGLLGIVNLRGEILPAASLQPWFGDGATPTTANLFLVVRAASSLVALRIDRFEQVVPVPDDGIHSDDEPGLRAEVAPKVWRGPSGNVHCLSADALFEALKTKRAQPEESPVS
jgi:chemotaxis signal transduction protein